LALLSFQLSILTSFPILAVEVVQLSSPSVQFALIRSTAFGASGTGMPLGCLLGQSRFRTSRWPGLRKQLVGLAEELSAATLVIGVEKVLPFQKCD